MKRFEDITLDGVLRKTLREAYDRGFSDAMSQTLGLETLETISQKAKMFNDFCMGNIEIYPPDDRRGRMIYRIQSRGDKVAEYEIDFGHRAPSLPDQIAYSILKHHSSGARST